MPIQPVNIQLCPTIFTVVSATFIIDGKCIALAVSQCPNMSNASQTTLLLKQLQNVNSIYLKHLQSKTDYDVCRHARLSTRQKPSLKITMLRVRVDKHWRGTVPSGLKNRMEMLLKEPVQRRSFRDHNLPLGLRRARHDGLHEDVLLPVISQ